MMNDTSIDRLHQLMGELVILLPELKANGHVEEAVRVHNALMEIVPQLKNWAQEPIEIPNV